MFFEAGAHAEARDEAHDPGCETGEVPEGMRCIVRHPPVNSRLDDVSLRMRSQGNLEQKQNAAGCVVKDGIGVGLDTLEPCGDYEVPDEHEQAAGKEREE